MMNQLVIVLWISVLFSCTADNTATETAEQVNTSEKQKTQLNITVLLDLSDRIDPQTNPEKPEHFQRDIAIVKYLSEYFIKDMENTGTYMAKGKMKVIVSPKPQDPNINLFAEKLHVDLSSMDIKQKKDVHDNLSSTFTNNLNKIYETTIRSKKWVGSDIWRFFKNDVKDYCVEQDSNYRNILILLTDGYIYHSDSKDQQGNRYAYLLPKLIEKQGLRKNPNWEAAIEKQHFGLITKRADLNKLEVLVLEISPSANNKNDEDIIKHVLSRWFTEMHVKHYDIFNSDLPEYTKQRINTFLE